MGKGTRRPSYQSAAGCLGFGRLQLLLALGGFAAFVFGGDAAVPVSRQAERPKFFASEVLSEKDVVDAGSCLGAPDGRYAEIGPGGAITLLLERPLVDRGTIVYRGETNIGIDGWFHLWNTGEEGNDYAWIPFTPIAAAPGMAKDSVDFGSPYMGPSDTRGLGAEKIRIENAGPRSLFVDAVIVYGPPK